LEALFVAGEPALPDKAANGAISLKTGEIGWAVKTSSVHILIKRNFWRTCSLFVVSAKRQRSRRKQVRGYRNVRKAMSR
jgi:hypothetical protein